MFSPGIWAGAGIPLLFHRALRDALFPVAVVEHEVLRAGLTEDEALGVEEAEVEETSCSRCTRGA